MSLEECMIELGAVEDGYEFQRLAIKTGKQIHTHEELKQFQEVIKERKTYLLENDPVYRSLWASANARLDEESKHHRLKLGKYRAEAMREVNRK